MSTGQGRNQVFIGGRQTRAIEIYLTKLSAKFLN